MPVLTINFISKVMVYSMISTPNSDKKILNCLLAHYTIFTIAFGILVTDLTQKQIFIIYRKE